MRQNWENEAPFLNLNPLSRNPGSAPGFMQHGVQRRMISVDNFFVFLRLHGFGYNTDQCWTPNDHLGLIFLFDYTFYSHYNTDWIANTEIGLDPNNSVIKRLWCIIIFALLLLYVT